MLLCDGHVRNPSEAV
ncbi:hypothetical protein LI273_05555 [Blautia glucerasea]|nr:hypothetical protein [Blautia sp. MSK17_66]MCB6369003.1 hypothetical protein [Blautia glucerasea]